MQSVFRWILPSFFPVDSYPLPVLSARISKKSSEEVRKFSDWNTASTKLPEPADSGPDSSIWVLDFSATTQAHGDFNN